MNTTGRLLKALSDGNVDVLAVAASLQLGKSIPITRTQETIVARSMQKRSVTRSGIFAKALSVGWGHADVAYELSKTRAGCATLLLLNALSAGVSTFKASEGLQELLVYYGCTTDTLPTVDSLNTVVKYVAPIMIDSGFHAIMENIHIAITVGMKRTFSLQEFQKWQPEIMQDSVVMKEWVDSVRQLCWSASRNESLHIRINGRVAWLATFAVQILGMGCTVICGATALWETAGRSGKLVVHFGPSDISSITESLAGALRFSLELRDDAGKLQRSIQGRYLLKDAIRSEIKKSAKVTPSFYPTFCLCFVRYFARVFVCASEHCQFLSIVSEDQQPKAIARVLGYLGVKLTTQLEAAMLESLSPSKAEEDLRDLQCFNHLRGDVKHFAADLMEAVIMLAMSLISCHISADNFSVPTLQLDRIDEIHKEGWDGGRRRLRFSNNSWPNISLPQIWATLCDLCFFGDYPRRKHDSRSVAKSADGITLSIRMLFEDEAFTRDGQIFAIYPGQLAYSGIQRQDAVFPHRQPDRLSLNWDEWALAPGITFKHPHTPASRIVDIRTTVAVRDALEISTVITFEDQDSRRNYVFDALSALLILTRNGALADPCPHPTKDSFPVPVRPESADGALKPVSRSSDLNGWPFLFSAAILATRKTDSDCIFLCLPGKSQFHQLLSIALNNDRHRRLRPRFVLQEDACLSCTVCLGRDIVKADEKLLKNPLLIIICNPAASSTPQDLVTAS